MPRILVPTKSIDPALGLWFTNNYWFDYIKTYVQQGTAITFIGESYMNLGFAGILHGLIYGFILSFFNLVYMFLRKSLFGLWFVVYIYFNTFHYIFSFGSWLSFYLKESVFWFVSFLIIALLIMIKRRLARIPLGRH